MTKGGGLTFGKGALFRALSLTQPTSYLRNSSTMHCVNVRRLFRPSWVALAASMTVATKPTRVRTNFTMVPNHIVDDRDMDAYEARLFMHYVRVAGETGTCWESNATTSARSGMSERKMMTSRVSLHKKGLINVEHHRNRVTVRVTKLWSVAAQAQPAVDPTVTPFQGGIDTTETPIQGGTEHTYGDPVIEAAPISGWHHMPPSYLEEEVRSGALSSGSSRSIRCLTPETVNPVPEASRVRARLQDEDQDGLDNREVRATEPAISQSPDTTGDEELAAWASDPVHPEKAAAREAPPRPAAPPPQPPAAPPPPTCTVSDENSDVDQYDCAFGAAIARGASEREAYAAAHAAVFGAVQQEPPQQALIKSNEHPARCSCRTCNIQRSRRSAAGSRKWATNNRPELLQTYG